MTTMIYAASTTAGQPVQPVDSDNATTQSAGNFAAILQNSHDANSQDPAPEDTSPPQGSGTNAVLNTAIDNLGVCGPLPKVAVGTDPDTGEPTSPATKHPANDSADAQLSAQTADAILAMAQGLPTPAALPLPPLVGLLGAQPAATNAHSDGEIASASSVSLGGTTGTATTTARVVADPAAPDAALTANPRLSRATQLGVQQAAALAPPVLEPVPSTSTTSTSTPSISTPSISVLTSISTTSTSVLTSPPTGARESVAGSVPAAIAKPDAGAPHSKTTDTATTYALRTDTAEPDTTASETTTAVVTTPDTTKADALPTGAVQASAFAPAMPVLSGQPPASAPFATHAAAALKVGPPTNQGANAGTNSDPSTAGDGSTGQGQPVRASTANANTASAIAAGAANANAATTASANTASDNTTSATPSTIMTELVQAGLSPASPAAPSRPADNLNADAVTNLSSQAITTPFIASTSLTPVAAAQSPAGAQPLYEQLAAPVLHVAATGDGVNTIVVQLHPKDLGSVGAEIALHNGGISVVLSSGNDLTRATINAALPALHQQLANAGLTDIKLAVDASAVPSSGTGAAGGQLSNAQSQGSQDDSQKSRAAQIPHERSVSTSVVATDTVPSPILGRRLSTSGVDRWL